MREQIKMENIVTGAVLILLLTAMIAVSVAADTTAVQKEKYSIAVITKSTESEFFSSVRAGANAAATEYNVEMTFEGPKSEEDYRKQNEIIADAVERGVDAIVISAVDYNATAEEIDRAADAGVKIVVIDSDVNSEAVECRIGTDDFAAGAMAGEAALAMVEGDLHIGIINYDIHSANGQAREEGFRDAVSRDSRVKSMETINVLSSIGDARTKTAQFLRKNEKINVVATFNEWTSLGVGWAIRDLNAKDKTVIAFDNNVVSIGMLETGEVDALIVQNPYAMGYLGVENAYRLLKGGKKLKNMNTETTVITREEMFLPEYQKILFSFQ